MPWLSIGTPSQHDACHAPSPQRSKEASQSNRCAHVSATLPCMLVCLKVEPAAAAAAAEPRARTSTGSGSLCFVYSCTLFVRQVVSGLDQITGRHRQEMDMGIDQAGSRAHASCAAPRCAFEIISHLSR